MMTSSTPRLYVEVPLGEQVLLQLSEKQSRYLTQVLRLQQGDAVRIFNGTNGEWRAEIYELQKKQVTLSVKERLLAQQTVPDLWLVFAPIKLGRIDYLVEKATELGVRELHPVRTERTVISRLAEDRLRSHMVEAAEQTERLDVPVLHSMRTLVAALGDWPRDRTLIFCDESGSGGGFSKERLKEALDRTPRHAVLIGPEGGFSSVERSLIARVPQAVPLGLGPRILRADTAAIAALSAVQMMAGDWNIAPQSA